MADGNGFAASLPSERRGLPGLLVDHSRCGVQGSGRRDAERSPSKSRGRFDGDAFHEPKPVSVATGNVIHTTTRPRVSLSVNVTVRGVGSRIRVSGSTSRAHCSVGSRLIENIPCLYRQAVSIRVYTLANTPSPSRGHENHRDDEYEPPVGTPIGPMFPFP
jgi:hypothetical protein